MIAIRELRSDLEIDAAFPVVVQLRGHLRRDCFLALVRRQQVEGYRLFGGFADDGLVVVAGVRRTSTLARDEHLFVDDLVTDASARGRGHATEMLRWLAARAQEEGLDRICLDSRDTARGFYEQLGFTFRTSIPCCIEVDRLT